MAIIRVDDKVLAALEKLARSIVALGEAEEPLRRGKDHYSHRDRYDQARGAYLDSARDLLATLNK